MPPTNVAKLSAANTPLMTRVAIGKISETLVADPVARQAFLKNPNAFVKQRFGLVPGREESDFLKDLRQRFADGFCCGGCACGPSDLAARSGRIR